MKGDIITVKLLKNNATVSSLATVYPYIAPEKLTTSFIVVNLENSENSHTKTSASLMDIDTVSVVIVTTKLDTTIALNEAVRNALDFYSGDVAFSGETLSVERIWLDNTSSYLEKETSKTLYIIDASYILRIRRTL